VRNPERSPIQCSLVFEHNLVEKLLVLGHLVLLLKVDESLLILLDENVIGGARSGEGSLIKDIWIGNGEGWDIVDVSGFVDDVSHLGVFPGVGVSVFIVVWMWVDLRVDADSRGGGNKGGEFEEFHI
tara:strand:+ start:131 stop:511 length:381 start_codon:yes stop_codon:yes gene_type:complete